MTLNRYFLIMILRGMEGQNYANSLWRFFLMLVFDI